VFYTHIESLHLLLELPPGALNGLVGAGLVRQGFIRIAQLKHNSGVIFNSVKVFLNALNTFFPI
jgi:hypothetical protein